MLVPDQVEGDDSVIITSLAAGVFEKPQIKREVRAEATISDLFDRSQSQPIQLEKAFNIHLFFHISGTLLTTFNECGHIRHQEKIASQLQNLRLF